MYKRAPLPARHHAARLADMLLHIPNRSAKTRNLIFAGFGTAGPGIMAGVMLTLNKVAMALFTAFGPLFILCLIFDQTKSLFQRWLLYGIGTIFSLAVLALDTTVGTRYAGYCKIIGGAVLIGLGSVMAFWPELLR